MALRRLTWGGVLVLSGWLLLFVGVVMGGRSLIHYLNEAPPEMVATDEISEFKTSRAAAFHTVERVVVGMLGALALTAFAILVAMWLGKRDISFTVRTKQYRSRSTYKGRSEKGRAERGKGKDRHHRRYSLGADGELSEEH